MKPFLILQLRPVDAACQNELEAILRFGQLKESEIVRIRMEEAGIPNLNLEDYSGVIVGGGASNVSDPVDKKTAYQLRFENDLDRLLTQIVEEDFPYLGCCYGLGILGRHLGGQVSKDFYSEPAGGSTILLTPEGERDELMEGLPTEFRALVGHKEACQFVPAGATLLAESEDCLVQMIRYKSNIYATQFHPEMDQDGLIFRIHVYNNHGYYEPDEMEQLIDRVSREEIIHPQMILKNFVSKYKQP